MIVASAPAEEQNPAYRPARPHKERREAAVRRFPPSASSTDFVDLAPGRYDVIVQELNDQGLDAGVGLAMEIAAAPSPTSNPTTSPVPSPSSIAQ